MSGNVKQFVDYSVNTNNDTGLNDAASIRPITNGENVDQTVLQRPSESLRQRSEAIRNVLRDTLYLRDADRSLIIAGPGRVTWSGTASGSGDGIPVISDNLYLIPMLTPGAAQVAPIPPVQSTYGTLHLKRASDNMDSILVTSQRRSYAGGDQISIVVTSGSVFSCTLKTEDAGTYQRTIEIVATAATTLSDVITALTALTPPSPDNTQLVAAALEGGALGTDLILRPQAKQFVSGNYDGEGHTITPANLAAFFASNPSQVLEEGDTLCVQFSMVTDTASTGGRRQAIPENSNTAIPAASFFNSRVHPEKLVNALPICKVVNNRLVFGTGVEVPAGSTSADLSGVTTASPVLRNGGFEHGVTASTASRAISDWRINNVSNAQFRLSTTGPASGAKCLELNATGTTNIAGDVTQFLELPVEPGQGVRVMAAVEQVKAPSAGTWRIRVAWGDADSAPSSQNDVDFTVLASTDAGYRLIDQSFVVPAGKRFLKSVAIEATGIAVASTGIALRVDNVQVFVSPVNADRAAAMDDARLNAALLYSMVIEDPSTYQVGQLAALLRFDKSTPTSEGKVVLERKDQDYSGANLPPALEHVGRLVNLGGQLLADATNAAKPRIEMSYSTVNYTLLFESARNGETVGAYTQPAARVYMGTGGALHQTFNARWTGTAWRKDITGTIATRQVAGSGSGASRIPVAIFQYRGTVDFADGDWEEVTHMNGYTPAAASTQEPPLLGFPRDFLNGSYWVGFNHLAFLDPNVTVMRQNWMGSVVANTISGDAGTWSVSKVNTATIDTSFSGPFSGRELTMFVGDNNDACQFESPYIWAAPMADEMLAQLSVYIVCAEFGFNDLEFAFGFMHDPGIYSENGAYFHKKMGSDRWTYVCKTDAAATEVLASSAFGGNYSARLDIELYGPDVLGTAQIVFRESGFVSAVITTNLPDDDAMPIAAYFRSGAIGLSSTMHISPILYQCRRKLSS